MGAKLIPQTVKVKTITYVIDFDKVPGGQALKARLNGFTVKGEGGWQSLMTEIKSQVDGDTLELPQALFAKMIDKATAYGSGGYQGVIRWILCVLLAQHSEAILGVPQTLSGALGKPKGKGNGKPTTITTITEAEAGEGAVA